MFRGALYTLATLLLTTGVVFAYTNPGNPTGYVNDFAHILKTEDITTLNTKLTDFEKQTSNEIVVVTIPSLDGDTVENYAVKLFEDWKIGKKDTSNGVLLLIAPTEKQMRIEVGYGLEGALTDAQSYWIINNELKPAFQQNKYAEGIATALDTIMGATQGEYVPSEKTSGSSHSDFSPAIIIFGFFIIQFFAAILGRSKSWWLGGVIGAIGGWFLGGFFSNALLGAGTLALLGLGFDYIVSKAYARGLTTGRIPWYIGGKGFGSSGNSGGGFGGFGGGSSGGGGASGGW